MIIGINNMERGREKSKFTRVLKTACSHDKALLYFSLFFTALASSIRKQRRENLPTKTLCPNVHHLIFIITSERKERVFAHYYG
jgi:hypothetical protein